MLTEYQLSIWELYLDGFKTMASLVQRCSKNRCNTHCILARTEVFKPVALSGRLKQANTVRYFQWNAVQLRALLDEQSEHYKTEFLMFVAYVYKAIKLLNRKLSYPTFLKMRLKTNLHSERQEQTARPQALRRQTLVFDSKWKRKLMRVGYITDDEPGREIESDMGLVSGINLQYVMYRQINRICYRSWAKLIVGSGYKRNDISDSKHLV